MHALHSTQRPWIHTLVGADTRLTRDAGSIFAARLDGRRMRSPGELFTEIARALSFPGYFGQNWDALDECLNDLSWLPAKNANEPIVLIISDAGELLQNEPELKKLLLILSSASVRWNQPPKTQPHNRAARPFHTVFECKNEREAEWMIHIAGEAGVDASILGALTPLSV